MAEQAYIPRLKTQYHDVIKGDLTKEFGYANVMQVPRLDKVVLNMGVGEAVSDSKKVKAAAADLGLIAGQRPVITKAHYDVWNKVYRGYFTKEFPARAFIGSGKLLFGARFEIQGIAVKR